MQKKEVRALRYVNYLRFQCKAEVKVFLSTSQPLNQPSINPAQSVNVSDVILTFASPWSRDLLPHLYSKFAVISEIFLTILMLALLESLGRHVLNGVNFEWCNGDRGCLPEFYADPIY